MSNKKYEGIVVPLVTPLTTNFQLDENALLHLNKNINTENAHPFILGTTGESASFSFDFKKRYIHKFAEILHPLQTSYVGISANCIEESIALANISFNHNIDAVVATLPNYYQLTPNEMLIYFKTLANSINGNLVIYNIPATTHSSIPIDIVFELSKISNIVAVKDSERDIDRLNTCIAFFKNHNSCAYLIGWAAQSANGLQKGAQGIVPSTANINCAIYSKLVKAIAANNFEIAQYFQTISDELGSVYQSKKTLGQSLWALKVLLNSDNITTDIVMPPLQKLTEVDKQELIINYLNIKNKYEL
jgi:dihydrodipicolinate synthase/N-acetylneuraminate lyase